MPFRLCLPALLLLGLLCGAPSQAAPDPDAAFVSGKTPLPGLRLTLRTDRARYEQGEPIPITLRYTYDGDRPLTLEVVTGDRSGRITDFGFTATDAEGKAVPDPIPSRGVFSGGGLSGSARLKPSQPYEQTVTLNEWLRFDAPGRYVVTAQSRIVHLTGDGGDWADGPDLPLTSAPLVLQIAPPNEAHLLARLARDAADLSSKSQDARTGALRDLRFLGDARAISLLVRGLHDPYVNAALEASFGLRAFPDLDPVKAEILRAVADPGLLIPPSQQYSYLSLLVDADLQAQGKATSFGDSATTAAYAHWEGVFARRLQKSLTAMTPGRAAEVTVEGLALGSLSRADPANWRPVLVNASLMSAPSQQYAGSLMETSDDQPESFPDLQAFRSLQPELRRVRADTRLDPALRSGAVLMLHALADDAFRPQLAADVAAPKPTFTDAAHRTLGGYHAAQIGDALLALARSSDDDTRRSASVRLRDFGAAVHAERLRALLAREKAANAYDDGRDALLEALALKSPALALPLLAREAVKPGRPYQGVSDLPIRLLCRLRGPDARRVVLGLFASPNPETRQTVAQALGDSWESIRFPNGDKGRRLLPDAPLAASYFPSLLTLAGSDPSGSVRGAARLALAGITGLPPNGLGQGTSAGQQALLPPWEDWWRRNRARYAPP